MITVERLRLALAMFSSDPPELLAGDPRDPLLPDVLPPTPAAVLVPIVRRADPTVLLTVRPATMRRHAGQIAFPGGRIEAEDADALAAALREAEEEIGLPRDQAEVIGIGDLYRTVTGFEVTPVVGLVPPDLPLVAQAEEVAEIFEVPLRHLLTPEHQIVRSMLWQGRERRYYEIEWEGRRIWGATAAMIVNLSRRLALVP
jgi:8-oxo-dGTP pyrophosphatase MutT (NUDIX family)